MCVYIFAVQQLVYKYEFEYWLVVDNHLLSPIDASMQVEMVDLTTPPRKRRRRNSKIEQQRIKYEQIGQDLIIDQLNLPLVLTGNELDLLKERVIRYLKRTKWGSHCAGNLRIIGNIWVHIKGRV